MIRYSLLLLVLTVPCVAQTPKEATVRVYTYADNNRWPDFYGSGVLVSDVFVLTNWHVVRKRRDKGVPVTVRFSDGHRSNATVEFEDKDKDVALLKISPHPTFQPMEFGVDVEYNENVDTYGYTYDYEFVHTSNRMWHRRSGVIEKGKVTSERNDEGCWFAIVGKRRVPGDSGGPVVKNNKIIGIVQHITRCGPIPITVCIRVDTILRLIEDKIK